jgi:hypothetical protein
MKPDTKTFLKLFNMVVEEFESRGCEELSVCSYRKTSFEVEGQIKKENAAGILEALWLISEHLHIKSQPTGLSGSYQKVRNFTVWLER